MTRIYNHTIFAHDARRVFPFVEDCPVIGTDYDVESVAGKLLAQSIESVDCVGGPRECEFQAGCDYISAMSRHHLRHAEASHVEHLGISIRERVLRRHHQPHPVDVGKLRYPIGKHRMTGVNWIERASKDAYPHSLIRLDNSLNNYPEALFLPRFWVLIDDRRLPSFKPRSGLHR